MTFRIVGSHLAGLAVLAGILGGCASSAPAVQTHVVGWGAAPLPEIQPPDTEVTVEALPPAVLPSDSVLLALAVVAEHPEEAEATLLASGTASYYGSRFAGRRTASGERFNPDGLTAAHRTLPFGSVVRVTNLKNAASVVVRINDRGPFAHGRVIDLSYAAAQQIGMIRSGTAPVQLELLPPDTVEIED